MKYVLFLIDIVPVCTIAPDDEEVVWEPVELEQVPEAGGDEQVVDEERPGVGQKQTVQILSRLEYCVNLKLKSLLK